MIFRTSRVPRIGYWCLSYAWTIYAYTSLNSVDTLSNGSAGELSVPYVVDNSKIVLAEFFGERPGATDVQLAELEGWTNLVVEQAEQNIEGMAQDLDNCLGANCFKPGDAKTQLVFVHYHLPELSDLYNPIVSFVLPLVYLVPKQCRNWLSVPFVIFSTFHSVACLLQLAYQSNLTLWRRGIYLSDFGPEIGHFSQRKSGQISSIISAYICKARRFFGSLFSFF